MTYALEEIIPKAHEWCTLDRVPAEQRAPKKLQGLFWMKDYDIASDIVYCANLGRWDPQALVLSVPIFEAFMFFNNPRGNTMLANTKGVVHNFKFNSPKLDFALVKPGKATGELKLGGSPINHAGMTMLGKIGDFEFKEVAGDSPGDKWERNNKFFSVVKSKLTNYKAWRIMDGNGKINPARQKEFVEQVGSKRAADVKKGVSVMKCE